MNSETSTSISPTHGSEDPLEETQNDHETESVDEPREESEDDFMMLFYAALLDAREGGVRWLKRVATAIQDEEMRAGILSEGDQAEGENRFKFGMWAPVMEFEILLNAFPDNRWSMRHKSWLRDRLLSIAAETRVPEQWLVLAACLKEANDIPMRLLLWRACVDAIPEAALPSLTQALLSREESDARDDRIPGLAIIANRLSQSPIDLPDEISPDEIVTHLLGSNGNGVTIWSKPRTHQTEIYGKVNPVLAQSWGLAVLYRYLDSDYFVDKRRDIGELLVNKLRELLESDLWRDGDTVWDLQTVLETIGDEDILADTRRLFSQLKAQGWT